MINTIVKGEVARKGHMMLQTEHTGLKKLRNGGENTEGVFAFSALAGSHQLTFYMRTFLGYHNPQ